MTDEQSTQAADYLARFGLQREPFAADPDPEFFCADSALTQRLDMLQNLTEFGMLTLLVIGKPGVGKTSVLQQYLQRANSNWRVCHLAADALGNTHDLVRDMAAGFHFPGADLAQLRTQLDEMHAQGQLAVLVVDDAERLPDAALRTLLELSGAAGETEKRLRLVLFGTEQLQEKIAALSSGHADNTHVFNIPPLSELQAAAYLQHRLKVAGQHDDAVFTPGQIKSIVKASHGVPAQINARARQLLIDRHGVSGGSHTVTAAIASPARRYALIGAAAVGVLLIAVALWPRTSSHDTETSNSVTESAAPAPEKTVDLALPNVAPAANPGTAGTSAEPVEQAPEAAAAPLPVPTLGPEVDEHPVPTSPTGKIAVSRVPAPETAAPPAPAGSVGQPTAPALTTVTLPVAQTQSPDTKEARPPAPVTEMASPSAKPAPEKTKAVARAEQKTLPSSEPTQAPKPAATAAGATAVKGVTSNRGTAWLKTQRSGDYTLQILGGRREAAIRQFAAANRLEGTSTILRTTRDGKPWYVLLYGAYPSRAAASQALAQMPATVRAAKPWPRSIATVQAEITK